MTRSHPRARLAALLVSALAAGGAAWAQAEPQDLPSGDRVALVVGNGDYAASEDLSNAVRDGEAVAESLQQLNFTVHHASNLTRAGFEEAVARVDADLAGAEALVIYYSGHGLQLGGENYLVPVDFAAASAEEATAAGISLSALIERLSSRDRPTLIFLDSCRNNPLPESVTGPDRAQGLARIEVGENIHVVFATDPGNVSYDGGNALSSQLSFFTHALVKYIEQPGLDLSDLVLAVTRETNALTIGNQTPWIQSSLLQEFYFTEQQQIDEALLGAAMERILSDPARLEQFTREFASEPSLHARAVSFIAEMDMQAPDITVASNNLATTDVKALLAPDLERLIAEPAEPEEGPSIDLVKFVQGELQRLGCYRMAVDGEWGPGSRRALRDYYRETRQPDASLEPTLDVWNELLRRSGRVCREPVRMVQRAEPAAVTPGGAGRQRAARPTPIAPAPAPLPPGIGGGIGIGGVF